MEHTIAVYGATGHTGRFVVAELLARGYLPIPSGRDLAALRTAYPDLAVRQAAVADPAALDRALTAAAAVINCAGPFATTAAPVIDAALRAGIPYVDIAAEIEANADTFATYAHATTPILPAMAFYGGLGDLLATTAMADWTSADEAHVAYALSSWHPTPGTRAAGAVSAHRRNGRRIRYTAGRLTHHESPPTTTTWHFPSGPRQLITDFTMADVVTIPSHLRIPEVRTHMSVEAAEDLAAAASPPSPTQTFTVDVHIRSGATTRRATATGQDIYAITAPLAVEATHRILTGRTTTTGLASAGRLFDAPDFLAALAPHLSLT